MTILPLGKTIEVAEGSTVLEEGRESLSKIARAENEHLDQIVGAGSKSRLACQAKARRRRHHRGNPGLRFGF